MRFATYTGAKKPLTEVDDNEVRLVFKDRTYRLEITAQKAPSAPLVSPIGGHMTGKVNESIDAKVQIKLYKDDQLVLEDSGDNTGLEVGGEYSELLT